MPKYHSVARDGLGNTIPSPTVTVYEAGTTDIVEIFSDKEMVTQKANPFTGESDGSHEFFTVNGSYRIDVTKSGYSGFSLDNVDIVGFHSNKLMGIGPGWEDADWRSGAVTPDSALHVLGKDGTLAEPTPIPGIVTIEGGLDDGYTNGLRIKGDTVDISIGVVQVFGSQLFRIYDNENTSTLMKFGSGNVTFDDGSVSFSNGFTVASMSVLGGAGTPEGSIAAPVGSLYMRSDGGAGTSLYVKESGAGNTGWVAK